MNCPKGEWETNLRRHAEWMARGREMGCEMIVFPEASLSGYCDFTRFPEAIQGLDSPYLERFASLSAQYGIAASAGFLETNPAGPPFITQVVARDGQIIAVYRKNHIPEEE